MVGGAYHGPHGGIWTGMALTLKLVDVDLTSTDCRDSRLNKEINKSQISYEWK